MRYSSESRAHALVEHYIRNMASTVDDFKIAGIAAGFTLGFGFLTVWKAIKQTRSIKVPHRSTYVYLIWGEVLSNVCIGIVGWLFLEGIIPDGYGLFKLNPLMSTQIGSLILFVRC